MLTLAFSMMLLWMCLQLGMIAHAMEPAWKNIERIWRPDQRMAPSAWARVHFRINPELTPTKNPLFDPSYFPWMPHILDVLYLEPWLAGWIFMKPTQVGGTVCGIVQIACDADQNPGPALFITTTENQARKFSHKYFGYAIKHSARLKRKFLRGREHRETQLEKPFIGGNLSLVGSGSSNSLISNPQQRVYLDELDQLDDFPEMGSAFEIATKRTSEFDRFGDTAICGWAHPTTEDHGVAKLYRERTDQREWTLRCPHCKQDFVPKWSHVQIPDPNDAHSAFYRCPHDDCNQMISDAQRWNATRNGRFVSQLDEAERAKKDMAGFHVSQLCHPTKTVLDLTREFLACKSESQLRVFHNMVMGYPFVSAQRVLTLEAFEDKRGAFALNQHILDVKPVAPGDTWRITCGVDVQRGGVLYVRISAWTLSGNEHVLWYGRLQGFPALSKLLSAFVAKIGTTGREGSISACGIDWGFMSREVFDFCRRKYGNCIAVPMKYGPHVKPSDPIKFDDTIDPDRPHLGKLKRLNLNRTHWMDRQMQRFHGDSTIGGAIVIPKATTATKTIDAEFRNHIFANVYTEEEDEFGEVKGEYKRVDKSRRDDFFQAGVYGEVVAFLMGLDRLHERLETVDVRAPRGTRQEINRNVRSFGTPWVPTMKDWAT